MFVAAFNASDNPVQIDDEGRSLAAGAFGAVWRHDVTDAVNSGALHVFHSIEDGPGQNPEAVAAYEDAQKLNAEKAEADKAAAAEAKAAKKNSKETD